jgi:hypothetical protein
MGLYPTGRNQCYFSRKIAFFIPITVLYKDQLKKRVQAHVEKAQYCCRLCGCRKKRKIVFIFKFLPLSLSVKKLGTAFILLCCEQHTVSGFIGLLCEIFMANPGERNKFCI